MVDSSPYSEYMATDKMIEGTNSEIMQRIEFYQTRLSEAKERIERIKKQKKPDHVRLGLLRKQASMYEK